MKQIYTLLLLLVTTIAFAQIPTGYYNSATGTGYTLKTQLHNIIDNHNDQGYNAMDGFIANYDLDNYYETSSNTILDIYSENPLGADPYTYSPVSDECGNYNSEGDCYNKEHVIPQSVFSSATPMRSDAHQLMPTDGRVNGFRSNSPFGRVDDSQLTNQSGISNPTQNGSKLGNNLNSGYSAGYTNDVFEPIDEFKGDIARIYFYFVTRYEDQVSSWSAYDMFDGSSDKVLADPFLNILRTWHEMDPVSQKEIDRNNNIYYNHQSNRNPFIDHPEWVALVWNTTTDTEAPTDPTNLVASNPSDNTIDLNWTASTDDIAVASYDIYVDNVNTFNTGSTSFTATGLTPDTNYCFTIKAKDATGNESGFSNQDCETTLESFGQDCINENFENIPANSGSYSERAWTGDDGHTWNATDARTDQTLNGRAITIRNGMLTTPNAADFPGIEDLTVTTQRVFGGDSGTFDLVINGNVIATIPYSDTPQTTTIPCFITEDITDFTINNNSNPSNRVMFDDLKWTCFLLSNEEFNQESFKIYPNPVNNSLHINLIHSEETKIEIFSILGKRVISKTIYNSEAIDVSYLNKGIYILKLTQNNTSVSKKLIKK